MERRTKRQKLEPSGGYAGFNASQAVLNGLRSASIRRPKRRYKEISMENNPSARAAFLNTLKQQIRAVTKALDTTDQVFGQSLEATSVKHEVTILLSELGVHGLLPEPHAITPQEYMRCALRTLYPDLTRNERLGLCGLGLSGEIGEVTDLLKKFLYHRNGKPLDKDRLKDELGDVLWYFFVLLDTLGLPFEAVMLANAIKLEQRHHGGFHPQYVSDSHASEVEL
jgi:NTP pyrophosphatase (non-canonical NTP hydrolase)